MDFLSTLCALKHCSLHFQRISPVNQGTQLRRSVELLPDDLLQLVLLAAQGNVLHKVIDSGYTRHFKILDQPLIEADGKVEHAVAIWVICAFV